MLAHVRAEVVPERLVAALADEVEVELTERGPEPVRVLEHERAVLRVGDLEPVVLQLLGVEHHGEHARVVDALHLAGPATLGQHAHRDRVRAVGAHEDPVIDGMGPQHGVGIGVLARDESLDVGVSRGPRPKPHQPSPLARRSMAAKGIATQSGRWACS